MDDPLAHAEGECLGCLCLLYEYEHRPLPDTVGTSVSDYAFERQTPVGPRAQQRPHLCQGGCHHLTPLLRRPPPSDRPAP